MKDAAMEKEKIVGIIGGMGPEATVDLMQRIIAFTPAKDDVDHIHVLVDNNPKVPSRIKAIIEGTGESPAPCMIRMAQGLVKQGADFLAIPCNTAHHYYEDVAAAVDVPVLNIVELTAEHARKKQPELTKVGLLASSALQMIHLYEPWFEKHGIEVVYPEPEKQERLMTLIRDVKANKHTTEQLLDYKRAGGDLIAQGAQCLLIACTELSVINEQIRFDIPFYDASDVLAKSIIHEVREG